MAAKSFRATIGKRRITAETGATEATFTRSTRAQLKAMEDIMSDIIDGIKGVTEEALRYGLVSIYNRSQQLVPVDTGALKASGEITTIVHEDRVTGAVSYGRKGVRVKGKTRTPVSQYAAIVHEDGNAYHKPPTQWKYLETAVNERANQTVRRIKKKLQEELS